MIGYLYGMLYIISIATSLVWIDSLGETYQLGYLLFGTTLTATLIFNACCFDSLSSTYRSIHRSPMLWLSLSIAILMTWGLSYYATIHSSATILVSLFFIAQAMMASLLNRRYHFVFACLLLIGFICYAAEQGSWLTYFSGILAGIFSYAYFKVSFIYSKKLGLKPTQVLAVRYYLLLAFASGLVIEDIMTHQSIIQQHHGLSFSLLILFLLGLSNMVIPNFFSQSCVQKIGPSQFASITTLIPVITYLCQGIIQNEWNVLMLCATISAFILLNIMQFFDHQRG